MMIASSITAFIIYITGNYKRKITIGSASAALIITISDIAQSISIEKGSNINYILFSFLCNILGGFLLSLILTYLNYLLFDYINKSIDYNLLLWDFVKKITMILFILIVLLLSSYFLFIYQNPAKIFLSLESWETIVLSNTSKAIDSSKEEHILIPFKTSRVLATINGDNLVLNWHFMRRTQPNKLIEKKTRIKITYFDEKKNKKLDIFNKFIPKGEIVFSGKNLTTFIQNEIKQDNFDFSALINQKKIGFTKDAKRIPMSSIFEKSNYDKPEKIPNIIGLWSERGGMKTFIKDAQVISLRFIPTISTDLISKTHKEEGLDVKIPNNSNISIKTRENLKIIIGEKGEQPKGINIDNDIETLAIENLENKLSIESLNSEKININSFYVALPQGYFNINENKIQIGDIEYLYIDGNDLEIRTTKQGRVNIIGSTSKIMINDIPYPLSIWSNISKEIKGVIIGAIFTLLITLVVKNYKMFKK